MRGIDIRQGDCLAILPTLAENSIDAVITDPPYHLTSIVKRFGASGAAPVKVSEFFDECGDSKGTSPFVRSSAGFMGKTWDGGDIAFRPATWAAVLRVLKPGGYLLAFASTRGFGRMSVAIEDAGFITHPLIAWVFGSGFPKATRIKADGYDGFRYGGQALKPAIEPIYMGQKPFSEATGTANILLHGTGALNIDGCRIFTDDEAAERENEATQEKRYTDEGGTNFAAKPGRRYTVKRLKPGATLNQTGGNWRPDDGVEYHGELKPGRWPANVVLDGSDEVLSAFPQAPGQQRTVGPEHGEKSSVNVYGDYGARDTFRPRSDSGSAARFFYSAKADGEDRLGSKHPTVKPVDLMAYLCRLITPPGGTVLDPFAGSGSTGAACIREGFKAVLIEREAEYVADIKARLEAASADGRHSASIKGRNTDQNKAQGADLPLFKGEVA